MDAVGRDGGLRDLPARAKKREPPASGNLDELTETTHEAVHMRCSLLAVSEGPPGDAECADDLFSCDEDSMLDEYLESDDEIECECGNTVYRDDGVRVRGTMKFLCHKCRA